MQAQVVQQSGITVNQSLQVVQTLLRAGLGCITYLRGLLPDENFTEAHLTASESPTFSHPGSQDSGVFERRAPSSSSIKLKTIKKGWSTEGDKLIEYMEEGIFDALEKQYLRSFIFAVYLDEKDPENIIEAYTFNFTYYTIPGTDSKVPVMTLGDKLNRLSLQPESTKSDPLANAVVKGKAPTLGEVKQSVKNLVRSLIATVQTLNTLPKRRFATFKLFYMDNVPQSYEPPHFSAGDPDNRYFFTTHSTKETPEKMSIGSLLTPYHGLELHIGSVTDCIPLPGDNDGASFGTLVNQDANSYSTAEDISLLSREKMIEVQRQDALLRKVMWDAENFANPEGDTVDAEGEDDPEYLRPTDITTEYPAEIQRTDETIAERNELEEGEVVSVSYHGMKEAQPDNFKSMEIGHTYTDNLLTQVIDASPLSGLPLTDISSSLFPSKFSRADVQQESVISKGIDTQLIQDIVMHNDAEDRTLSNANREMEMLDLETQKNDIHVAEDPKMLLGDVPRGKQSIVSAASAEASKKREVSAPPSVDSQSEVIIDCDCGVSDPEESGECQCEGTCRQWFHVWCMGYHSVHDDRLPSVFQCFSCRLRNDPQIEVLDSRNLTSQYIAKFRDLSLFRRALKIVQVHRPENATKFIKLLGSEVSVGGQTWKRLEAEGFIALQVTETDNIGFLEARENAQRKGKAKKTRKNMKRSKYAPVEEALSSTKFHDYFDPTKEGSLLGMTKSRTSNRTVNAVAAFKIPEIPQALESQTQMDETQLTGQHVAIGGLPRASNFKRKNTSEEAHLGSKRIKISIGLGVNLED